jgi:hypothetical protein
MSISYGRVALPLVLSLLLCSSVIGQPTAQERSAQASSALAQATDYSIPAAPAYAFLDASPAAVHTPHFPRDFRVDWLLQDDRLASNLAVEAAPVWLVAFDDVSAPAYRDLSWAARTVSTLNMSAATVGEGSERSLALSVKVTLYRASDPVADSSYTGRLSRALGFSEKQTRTQNRIDGVVTRAYADTTLTAAQKQAVSALGDQATEFGPFEPSKAAAYRGLSAAAKREIADRVDTLRTAHRAMTTVSDATEQRLRAIKTAYERAHWNAPRVDVAAGRVYGFSQAARVSQADSLSLRSAGWGAWINGATGFDTTDWLLSGLARAITRDDTQTFFAGGNVRYGGDDAHAFVEGGYRWGDRPVETIVAYGGSFSVTSGLNVQFGLRHRFDAALTLEGLAPKVKLNGRTSKVLGPLPF